MKTTKNLSLKARTIEALWWNISPYTDEYSREYVKDNLPHIYALVEVYEEYGYIVEFNEDLKDEFIDGLLNNSL